MEFLNGLDQIRLSPGDKMFFQSHDGIEKVNVGAVYIGLLRDRFILSEMPICSNGPLFHRPDINCTVRFLASGSVYGFSSRVVHITHNPVPILFIAYPQSVERMNLRKEERYSVMIPVQLKIAASQTMNEQPGTVVDLSTSGCRLISPFFCDSGEELLVNFILQEDSHPVRLNGTVRNFKSLNGSGYELGISFQDESSQLCSFVENIKGYLRVDK